MRGVFGGKPHESHNMYLDPILTHGAYHLNPAFSSGEALGSPVRRSLQQPGMQLQQGLYALTETSPLNAHAPGGAVENHGSVINSIAVEGAVMEEGKRGGGGGVAGGTGAVPPMAVPSGGQPI